MIMDQARSDSLDFVGTDRSPHPAATDGDATLHLTSHHGMGQWNNVVGIIVVMVELMGSKIDDFMPGSLELGDQLLLEFKPAMIGCKSYAHWLILFFESSKTRRKQLINWYSLIETSNSRGF
jgi:hypothetical protein